MMRMFVQNNIRYLLILSIIFISSSIIRATEISLMRFPGSLSQASSPDQKYLVINVDSENEKHASQLGGNHALYLQNIKTREQVQIYTYQRYVEVGWSPQGSRLLINDYAGSDYAVPTIFSIPDYKQVIHVKEQIQQQIESEPSIFENHHVYIIGTKWFNEDCLKIKIYGYGDIDPDGFTLWYKYTIDKGFEKLE